MNASTSFKVAISLLSLVILALVVFLTYGKSGQVYEGNEWRFLADLNALLNLSTSILLAIGLIAIKRGKVTLHKIFMISALITSACFFASYATYHSLYGDTKFLTQGALRLIYFTILITHILASGALVPFLLTTLGFIFMNNKEGHKRAAKWTWPIWLYVSVTGVFVYIFLKFLNVN